MSPGSFEKLSSEELLAQLREAEARGEDRLAAQLREELVRRHVGLVRSIAAEFSFTGEPFEDLVQAGYLGLLGAVANFDLAKGTKFSTYATHLIKGEIRHWIRNKYGAVHVPLWIRELSTKVTAAQDRLYLELGRPPTLEEIAQDLGVHPAKVREALKAREAMTYISLDANRRAYDPHPTFDLEKFLGQEERELPLEVRLRVAKAVEKLTELQRRIIQGLFYHGKSQAEVGKEVGLSQRQVSRLKDKILKELREELFGVEANGEKSGEQ
ncbi:MAG TPA: sigma-70 family RNA polymerase sigma factor [Candidatus Acetothermia bacterium]|nr:sigma-70 family RNA polymerase sigma factor [Candidatus Acetothermia bacterium]